MDLESIILSEVRQTQKDKYIISHICRKNDTNEFIYETDSQTYGYLIYETDSQTYGYLRGWRGGTN